MPRICATRRASSAASGEQHERFASQPSPPSGWVRLQTPTTSSEVSSFVPSGVTPATIAAATLESTPPLMAATIRLMRPIIAARGCLDRWRPGHCSRCLCRLVLPYGRAQPGNAARDNLDGRLDVSHRVLPPKGQAQRPGCSLRLDPHGQQDVAGLDAAGGARGAGRCFDPLEVERRYEVATLDPVDHNAGAVRQPQGSMTRAIDD